MFHPLAEADSPNDFAHVFDKRQACITAIWLARYLQSIYFDTTYSLPQHCICAGHRVCVVHDIERRWANRASPRGRGRERRGRNGDGLWPIACNKSDVPFRVNQVPLAVGSLTFSCWTLNPRRLTSHARRVLFFTVPFAPTRTRAHRNRGCSLTRENFRYISLEQRRGFRNTSRTVGYGPATEVTFTVNGNAIQNRNCRGNSEVVSWDIDARRIQSTILWKLSNIESEVYIRRVYNRDSEERVIPR